MESREQQIQCGSNQGAIRVHKEIGRSRFVIGAILIQTQQGFSPFLL